MALEIFRHMHDLLDKSERFTDKEGNIFVHSVLEAIENLDPELIGLLMGDAHAKERFFIPVAGAMVLNQNALIEFFTMNDYMKNSSYTSYTNKIGLIRKDTFIKKFDDTVLAWPHKDCVLEGGMSSEEAKKEEVFYNPILSKEEIDRLFEPKVLTNIKKYSRHSREGGNPACDVSIPDDLTMEDNLILKGNNLLALHSLKKRYAGKIKLIYIDPPYNTGNDGFKYNDRFNHSTWLTFMKNRLEVARELLREDGVIFVSIDDNEQAYLKVLMDEIFGQTNFIANIIWQHSVQAKGYVGNFSTNHNYTFLYKKTNLFDLGLLERTEEHNKNYSNPDNDPKGAWRTGDVRNALFRPNLIYDIITPSGKVIVPPKNGWRWSKETLIKKIENGEIIFSKDETRIIKKIYLNQQDGRVPETIWFGNDVGTTREANKELKNLDIDFPTPKPEKLIQRIIELSTEEGDIVLDYHLGSGTTAAVAHKMNRRYIGIEQMDYIETISIERLKKVIEGEQGGISKAVGWSGGGSFVYAELKTIDTFADAEIGKLNENMRYLPIGDIDDEEYGVTDEEKRLNKQFYGIGNG